MSICYLLEKIKSIFGRVLPLTFAGLVFSMDLSAQWTYDYLSQPRWNLAGTSVGGKVLFGGGTRYTEAQDFPSNNSNVVDIYDNISHTWSYATLSQGRSKLTATSVGNQAFFAGGYFANAQSIPGGSAVVDIYNVATNSWSAAALSVARYDLAAASAGTKAVFAGGTVYGGPLSSVVDIYNSSSNTWTTASLSVARTKLVAASVGTKIFFAGGESIGAGGWEFSNVVDIYDTNTDTWSTATLSQGRSRLAAASAGSKVFFAGGWFGSGVSDVVDIYDNSTGTWSTSTLSYARQNLAGTSAGTKVYFGGGSNSSGFKFSLVDIYDVSTNQWTTSSLYLGESMSLAAASDGTTPLFAGGYSYGAMPAVQIGFACSFPLSVTIPPPVCVGKSADLAASGGLVYVWNPRPYSPSINGDHVVVPVDNNDQILELLSSDANGCFAAKVVTLATKPVPELVVTPPYKLICSGSSTTLAISGAVQYNWSPATGLSATTGSTVTANPSKTTLYTIIGSGANGCENKAETQVVVGVDAFVYDPVICKGGLGTTLEAYGADSYSWSPATGLSSTTGGMIGANPSQTTTYTLTGTTTTGPGCNGTVQVTIAVSDPSPPEIVPSAPSICLGSSVTLTAKRGAFWGDGQGLSFPNQVTEEASAIASPSKTTTYTAFHTDQYGCSTSNVVTVTVNPLPALSLTSSAIAICASTAANLKAAGASTYKWSPSNGLSATTGDAVDASPLLNTTYAVTGKDAHGCESKKEILLKVNPLPTLNLTPGAATICKGASTTLLVSGAAVYNWAPTIGLSSATGEAVTANPVSTTTYTIKGTDANGCISTKPVQITVNDAVLTFTPTNPVICQGASTVLKVNGASKYSWSPSTLSATASGETVVASPTSTTTYSVAATDAFGCVKITSITLQVTSPPKPTITSIVESNQITSLTSNITAGNQWFKDGELIAGAVAPSLPIASSGVYTVRVTESDCQGVLSDPFPVIITGLDERVKNSMFRIYPNPSDRVLQIQWQGADGQHPGYLDLIDMTGRSLINKKMTSGELTIDVSELPPGFYVLRGLQGNATQVQKLVKN